MRPRSKSKQSQSHVHYHYHYYYPPEARTRTPRDNLSQSYFYQTDRQEDPEVLMTPSGKESSNRMYTEGDYTISKKMRMSDLWRVKKDFPSYNSAQHQQFSKIKAKSVVEEEIQQSQDEKEPVGESDFSEHKSRVTEAETWSNQSRLLAFYESELSKYKKEVDRLKMVEEECQYLRDSFLTHYTERCHK